jgi:hypothetical protein
MQIKLSAKNVEIKASRGRFYQNEFAPSSELSPLEVMVTPLFTPTGVSTKTFSFEKEGANRGSSTPRANFTPGGQSSQLEAKFASWSEI